MIDLGELRRLTAGVGTDELARYPDEDLFRLYFSFKSYRQLAQHLHADRMCLGKMVKARLAQYSEAEVQRLNDEFLPHPEPLPTPEPSPLLPYIQSHRDEHLTIMGLADEFGCAPREVRHQLKALREQGYTLDWIDEAESAVVMPQNEQAERPRHVKLGWRENDLVVGVVSDTHLCSVFSDLEVLEDLYDRFVAEGVEKVLHNGDLTSGPGMRGYRGHLYEVYPECQGPDGVIQYTRQHYPRRPGITTIVHAGNHDNWEWEKTGRDIIAEIAKDRPDMEYLGRTTVDVHLGPDEQTRIRMWHPTGGLAYSRSYKPQKNVEAMLGGTKPHLLLVGHYHVAGWFPLRNVHTLLCGCTEWQTPYMEGKSLMPEVGGYILHLKLDADGFIREFTPTWMYYYYPPGKSA